MHLYTIIKVITTALCTFTSKQNHAFFRRERESESERASKVIAEHVRGKIG